MPVLHQHQDGSGHYLRDEHDERAVVHDLRPEGAMILLNVYGIKVGGRVEPETVEKLVGLHLASLRPEPEPAIAVAPPVAPRSAPTILPATSTAPPSSLVRRSDSRGTASSSSPTVPKPTASRPVPIQDARPFAVRNLRRSRAREVALQVLYQIEQNPGLSQPAVDRFLSKRLVDANLCDFARGLVSGVRSNGPAIDAMITEVAENWRLDRMAAIDRNILRLGAFEMLFDSDVPPKVAINEALEIAKRYSTAQSSRFVNGILDRLLSTEQARKAAAMKPKPEAETEPTVEADPPAPPEG